MQGHGRIIAHDFCVAHREANSGLSTLNRTKSILSIYHQQRQLQRQRGMCLNDTYPFCQQPLSGNCHSICFSKPVLWTATPCSSFFVLSWRAGSWLSLWKSFVRSIHLIRFALRTTFPSRGRLFRIYNRSKTKPGKTELRFIHIFFYAA